MTICIVLGMHRSGTSLASGILHTAGIRMGDDETFIPRPHKQNPRGFFENIEFRRINDRLLEAEDYVVKQWNPRRPQISPSSGHRQEMRELLAVYHSKHEAWGWKDPRQCLTMDAWWEAIQDSDLAEQTRILFINRGWQPVAESLRTRNNVATLTHGVAVWDTYNRAAIDFIRSSGCRSLGIDYEDLLNEPTASFALISDLVGVDIDRPVVRGLIDQGLNRSATEEAGGWPDPHVRETEQLIGSFLARK